jgi:hypothetical protein
VIWFVVVVVIAVELLISTLVVVLLVVVLLLFSGRVKFASMCGSVSFLGGNVEFRDDDDSSEDDDDDDSNTDGSEDDDVEDGADAEEEAEEDVGIFGDGRFVLYTRNMGRTARRQVVVEKHSNRCLCR